MEHLIGTKVHFVAENGETENGVIKAAAKSKNFVFVVYKCNEDWEHYQNYTGQATLLSDLKPGWIEN